MPKPPAAMITARRARRSASWPNCLMRTPTMRSASSRIRAVTREDLLRVMRTYFAQSPAEIRMVPRAEAPAPEPAPEAPAAPEAEDRGADDAPGTAAP